MSDLSDYLVALAGRRWQWGQTDCLLILSDWIMVRRGVDPGARWRGTYSTEAECRVLLRREGGIRRLLSGALEAHGIKRTTMAAAGDVGLVRPVRELVGGICAAPDRWAVLTRGKGVVIAPMRSVGTWTI